MDRADQKPYRPARFWSALSIPEADLFKAAMISNQVSSLIHDSIAYLDAKIDPRNKKSSYFDPTALRACVIIGHKQL